MRLDGTIIVSTIVGGLAVAVLTRFLFGRTQTP